MHKVIIRKMQSEEKEDKCIHNWPEWSTGVSRFDWFYDTDEFCLITEGEAVIETEKAKYTIKAGDFVFFPKGLSCVWDVKKQLTKHYSYDYVF